jgi:hypothetical protein
MSLGWIVAAVLAAALVCLLVYVGIGLWKATFRG